MEDVLLNVNAASAQDREAVIEALAKQAFANGNYALLCQMTNFWQRALVPARLTVRLGLRLRDPAGFVGLVRHAFDGRELKAVQLVAGAGDRRALYSLLMTIEPRADWLAWLRDEHRDVLDVLPLAGIIVRSHLRLPIDVLDVVLSLGDLRLAAMLASHYRKDKEVLIRVLDSVPGALEHIQDRRIDGSCERVRDLMMLHGLGRKLSLASLPPEFVAAYDTELTLPGLAHNDMTVEQSLRVATILKREYDVRAMLNYPARQQFADVYRAYLASQSDEFVQRYTRAATLHEQLTGEPAILP